MINNLTKRQQAILGNVLPCNTLADVGCDHGYIGVALRHSGVVDRLYLCDISAPSLSKATKLADSVCIDNVYSYCQDGLGSLYCDCAVIAGMGGQEIISILDSASHKPQYLVLQPMRNQYLVRHYLLTHSYQIIRDYIVHDGKFYDIIVAKQGHAPMQSTMQLTLGCSNLTCATDDFRRYLQVEIDKCDNILQHTYVQDKADRRQLLIDAQQLIGG